MKDKIRQYWDKLIFIGIVTAIASWMISDYSRQEALQNQQALALELDLIGSRMSQLVTVNKALIEVTGAKLEASMILPENEVNLRRLLKPTIDRQTYHYSLYLAPDRIVNGSEWIDPQTLIKEGQKKYGELIYFGAPYFDGERKMLFFPIYTVLSDKKVGQQGILYTAIDASSLIRDFTRMDSQDGGQGFLVDHTGKAINLSLGSTNMTPETALLHQLMTENRLGKQGQINFFNHQVLVRPVVSTDWKLVYIERQKGLFEQRSSHVVLMGALVLIMLLIVISDAKRLLKLEKHSNEAANAHIKPETVALKQPYYDWLLREASQLKSLNTSPYADEIRRYKVNHCLELLGSPERQPATLSSKTFIKWIQKHVETSSSKLQIEAYSDGLETEMTPAMVQAGIELTNFLIESGLRGSIQIKGDSEDQLLVFSLYGEISKAAFEAGMLQNDLVTYDSAKDEAQISVVGNRVIISADNRRLSTYVSTQTAKEERDFPTQVYIYESETEQNAILKFYLDHLKVSFETVDSLKTVPPQSIVMVTESIYLSLTELDSLAYELPYLFVVCGDLETISSEEVITVSRPYALEKLEYALQRVAKRMDGQCE